MAIFPFTVLPHTTHFLIFTFLLKYSKTRHKTLQSPCQIKLVNVLFVSGKAENKVIVFTQRLCLWAFLWVSEGMKVMPWIAMVLKILKSLYCRSYFIYLIKKGGSFFFCYLTAQFIFSGFSEMFIFFWDFQSLELRKLKMRKLNRQNHSLLVLMTDKE